MPAVPSKPGLLNWLIVIGLSVIWGASFMSVKIALTGFGPLTIAACRTTLAAAALYAVMRVLRLALPQTATPTGRRIWAHIIGMGFFSNALPFFLLGWGMRHVASGFAGITMAAVPIFALVLAHWLVPGERMTLAKVLGFSLGIAGVVVLVGPKALMSSGADAEGLARLACVGSTLAYAIGAIVTRRCPPVNLVVFSAGALLMAALMAVPVALLAEGWPAFGQASPSALLALAYLGLGPTALATLLLVRVIKTAGPTFLTQSNYQVPVWSVVFGALVMHERLPAQFLAALTLILAGLAVSQLGARWLGRSA